MFRFSSLGTLNFINQGKTALPPPKSYCCLKSQAENYANA